MVMRTSPRQASLRELCPFPGQNLGFGARAVIDGYAMPGLEKVPGHGRAHIAEADETDIHDFLSSYRLGVAKAWRRCRCYGCCYSLGFCGLPPQSYKNVSHETFLSDQSPKPYRPKTAGGSASDRTEHSLPQIDYWYNTH
jgi:hypothetical protein